MFNTEDINNFYSDKKFTDLNGLQQYLIKDLVFKFLVQLNFLCCPKWRGEKTEIVFTIKNNNISYNIENVATIRIREEHLGVELYNHVNFSRSEMFKFDITSMNNVAELFIEVQKLLNSKTSRIKL